MCVKEAFKVLVEVTGRHSLLISGEEVVSVHEIGLANQGVDTRWIRPFRRPDSYILWSEILYGLPHHSDELSLRCLASL